MKEFRFFFFIHGKNTQKIFKTNGFIRSDVIENLDDDGPEIIFYTKKLRA
ncbi:TPA: hypothetical protein ACTZ5N_003947 [Bacillus cereus]